MLEEGGLIDLGRFGDVPGTGALQIGAGEYLLRSRDDRFAPLRRRQISAARPSSAPSWFYASFQGLPLPPAS